MNACIAVIELVEQQHHTCQIDYSVPFMVPKCNDIITMHACAGALRTGAPTGWHPCQRGASSLQTAPSTATTTAGASRAAAHAPASPSWIPPSQPPSTVPGTAHDCYFHRCSRTTRAVQIADLPSDKLLLKLLLVGPPFLFCHQHGLTLSLHCTSHVSV